MKDIRTDLVVDPSTLQPFTTNSLRFLQENTKQLTRTLLYTSREYWNFAYPGYGDPDENGLDYLPFVVTGVEYYVYGPQVVVTNGYIGLTYANTTIGVVALGQTGSTVPSPAYTVNSIIGVGMHRVVGMFKNTAFTNTPLLQPAVVYDSTDPVTFSDNTTKSVHGEVVYNVVDAASGTDITYNNVTYRPIKLYQSASGINQSYLYENRMQHSWRPLVYSGTTWADGGGAATAGYRIVNGYIELTGLITSPASGMTTTIGYTSLPFGVTNYDTQYASCTVYNNGTTKQAGNIAIGSGGVLTINADWSGSGTRSVILGGIRFRTNVLG